MALSSGPLEATSGEAAQRPCRFDLGVTSLGGYLVTRRVFTECYRLGQRDVVFVPFPVEALAFSSGRGGSRAPPELLAGACAGTEKRNEQSFLTLRELREVCATSNRRFCPGRKNQWPCGCDWEGAPPSRG